MHVLLCSKLTRAWFFIWLIVISIYLSTKAIKRYLKIKAWQFESAEIKEFDNGVLTMYLTSIIIGISSTICCAICVTMKTGNYANDSMKFGMKSLDFKTMRIKLLREQMGNQFIQSNSHDRSQFWIRIKHHFPAFFCCFYFMMSFSFLSVLPYFESEKIRSNLESSSKIWYTNLDVLFNSYAINNDLLYTPPVSPEFFNLCVCLAVHAFSYGSVFWKFNKYFSFIFTIVAFINGAVFMLDMALVELLIKLSRNPELLDSSLKLEFQWTPFLSILSIMSFLFMIVSQLSLFEYGYNRIKDVLIGRSSNDINDNCATYINSSNISTKLQYVWKQLCIDSWNRIMMPFVIGIISTVFSILVKLPYIYKSMTIIYAKRNLDIVLTNVIVSILYLISIVILWICLILKSTWSIKDYTEPVTTMNGDCNLFIPKPKNEVITIPVYASVNRHQPSSPPIDQEPNFPIFCDKMSTQWRYSCSPPSCAPNDSNSNSDATVSGKNQDIGNKKNYIYLSRINPAIDSPNFNQGIYSQLVKLTPQLSMTDNTMESDNTAVPIALSNEASDHSSNQTVHIIGPGPIELARRTIERSSLRNRTDINSEVATPEYFNIITSNSPLLLTRQIYEPITSSNTDAESNNLCTQV